MSIHGIANMYIFCSSRCRTKCGDVLGKAVLSFGFDSSQLAMILHSFFYCNFAVINNGSLIDFVCFETITMTKKTSDEKVRRIEEIFFPLRNEATQSFIINQYVSYK